MLKQISALEEDLGVQLIKREKRRFSLTTAGEYFYQQGKQLLAKAEELRRDGKPIQFNYCAFWKKNRTSYYIEEFVRIFYEKFGEKM